MFLHGAALGSLALRSGGAFAMGVGTGACWEEGKNASSVFACMTPVRDGAGPLPADCKQDLMLQALTGLSKSTCAKWPY